MTLEQQQQLAEALEQNLVLSKQTDHTILDLSNYVDSLEQQLAAAIAAERYYQEMKWGDLVDHPQSVGAYLTLMRVHLARAENAWAGANNDLEALHCLRKVLALGVACGEQYGLPKRDME